MRAVPIDLLGAASAPRDLTTALRMRLCLADPCRVGLLHEGRIGLAFGVSRTPVREVLQRLAQQGLVETRPGVGTVVAALEPARRGRDIVMLRGALRLAHDAMPPELPPGTRARLAGLPALASGAPDDLEGHVLARMQVLETVGELIDDALLRAAHEAMHWRAIRWRIEYARRAPGPAHSDLVALVDRLAAARRPSEVFDAVAREPDPD